jgi:hypothetical protein
MKVSLSKIEAQIAHWIEGSLSRILGSEISIADLTTRLARAMQAGVREDENGLLHAPQHYSIGLHPDAMNKIEASISDVRRMLAEGLNDTAHSQGFLINTNPEIVLSSDPKLKAWEISAAAWHQTSPLGKTHGIDNKAIPSDETFPRGAYLIVDGLRHIALNNPVINIGRKSENHVVLDDPHVSRSHAQLRARNGRFILFDLGSRGGTLINELPIREHILRPGDVFHVSGIAIVYGEDPPEESASPASYTPSISQISPPREDNLNQKGESDHR